MLEARDLARRAAKLGQEETASKLTDLSQDPSIPYSITLEEHRRWVEQADKDNYGDRHPTINRLRMGIKAFDIANSIDAIPTVHDTSHTLLPSDRKDYTLEDATVVTVYKDSNALSMIVQSFGRSRQLEEASFRSRFWQMHALIIHINPLSESFGDIYLPKVSESRVGNRLEIVGIPLKPRANLDQSRERKLANALMDQLSVLPDFQPKEESASPAA